MADELQALLDRQAPRPWTPDQFICFAIEARDKLPGAIAALRSHGALMEALTPSGETGANRGVAQGRLRRASQEDHVAQHIGEVGT